MLVFKFIIVISTIFMVLLGFMFMRECDNKGELDDQPKHIKKDKEIFKPN